jgi:hypothetical protein
MSTLYEWANSRPKHVAFIDQGQSGRGLFVVYANRQGGTTIEYDRPSSLFGQFKSAEVDAMAQRLDQRLLTFLKKVSM